MDDLRFGAALRAVRRRRRMTQAQLARAAGVSQATVSRVERGLLGQSTFDTVRAVARALGVRVDLDARWRGPAMDRLLDARHAELQQSIVRLLASHGWTAIPEVTFSHFGERGSIDVLGWHPVGRVALVVEVKSALVDLQDLLAGLDRKARLAPIVCREHGWEPRSVGRCVVMADGRTNRRRAAAHAALLRAALPDDGRRLRGWLAHPDGPLAATILFRVAAVPSMRGGTGRQSPGLRRDLPGPLDRSSHGVPPVPRE